MKYQMNDGHLYTIESGAPQGATAEARGSVFGAFYFYFYFSYRSEAGGSALPRASVD